MVLPHREPLFNEAYRANLRLIAMSDDECYPSADNAAQMLKANVINARRFIEVVSLSRVRIAMYVNMAQAKSCLSSASDKVPNYVH